MLKAEFYYGISGLSIPVSRENYPPEFRDKTRLEYYASLFNSLEVNSSFYKTPQARTVEKWVSLVPDGFTFTFKLSKAITHNKKLVFNEDDIEPFMKVIDVASQKKGTLLIQLPPSITIESINPLQELLSGIRYHNEQQWPVAVEVRHSSWHEREFYEILEEYDAVPVIHDIPASASPLANDRSPIIYLRFHGPEPRYRGSYTDTFLKEYAKRIDDWRLQQKTVYCYFNNTMGAAVHNLQTMLSFISK